MTGAAQKLVSVHRRDLIQAFRIEIADQMDHVSEDLLPREAFEEKYKEHFAALAMKRVEEAVSLVGQLDRK